MSPEDDGGTEMSRITLSLSVVGEAFDEERAGVNGVNISAQTVKR